MAQEVYVVENQTFPSGRTDINNIYLAIATNNSGASAPSTTYQYQWWFDESTNILKQRNGANSAWINMARLVGSVMVPIGSNTLSYADESDSCPTTDWTKESAEGWESRISAGGTGTVISNGAEGRLTTTSVAWGTPDTKDSREIDTTVIQWVSADGRFEVKKAGVYVFGANVRGFIDSINNNLTRGRHLLRGYGGTTGSQATDPAYTSLPTSDTFLGEVTGDVKTLTGAWQYVKTTTGTTEYVYPTHTMTGTAISGGFDNVIENAQVWCRCIRRDEA